MRLWPSRIRDGLVTIAAVWLAMAVAGSVPLWVPSRSGGSLVSLLVYTVLLAAYARSTGPGRRSAGAYFLAGFFPPLVCFILLTPLLPHLDSSFFLSGGSLVFIGLTVGFQASGAADTPIEAYLPLMWLNLLLPIVLVVGGRGFIRYHRPA
jgi:hypothetical protein